MKKISATLPDKLVDDVDRAAQSHDSSRAQIFRRALESYLADIDDEFTRSLALPSAELLLLNWDDVEESLLGADEN
jgi:metal-responsive CopG/Arc/MetJ family transcriptional regulator